MELIQPYGISFAKKIPLIDSLKSLRLILAKTVKYNSAFPYFPKEDIDMILEEFREILSGNGLMSMGNNVLRFEEEFAAVIKSKYAVATNSGTSALEVALKAINIKKNDEVLLPTQSCMATASCVITNGGKPIFCETDENFLLDISDVRKKINEKTKAVIIVYMAGLIPAKIFEIKDYLKKRNIYLIEDAAHALGARIKGLYAGNIGDFGCFSFYSTKIISTGEGGMITTNNDEHYKLCSSLRNRGIDVNANRELFVNLGSNKRMAEFQGILGRYQLKRLGEFIEHRNRVTKVYKDILAPIEEKGIIAFQQYSSKILHSYWKFVVFLKKSSRSREEIKEKMEEYEIKINWPYDPLLHLQPVFKRMYGTSEGRLKKTEELAKSHLCLPVHLGINVNDAEYIGKKLLEIIN